MGLDNYWEHDEWEDTDEDDPAPELETGLVGGLLSGHGQGSFRGGVYNMFIRDVTGVSLRQDKIPNETVQKMADDLDAYEWDGTEPDRYRHPDDRKEFDALRQMFRFYADEGAFLRGWW